MPDSDQDYKKDSVNLWVDPERKDRWQAYLEEDSEHQYLSQLIRQAVEQKISSHGNDSASVEVPDELASKFDEVQQSIDQLEQVTQEVESRLSGIERQVRDNPQLRQLANELFEILPTKDDIMEYESIVREAGSRPPNYVEPMSNSGRIADFAESLDVSEHQVTKALEKLQEDTHQVHTFERDGETRYYREG